MRCIRPINAGFNHEGKLTFRARSVDPELSSFEFECRKCLPCRLNIAREKAVRCWHESKMHENNIFLTLTYNPESLESPRLNYQHFQKFMKDLRYREDKKIPFMVTGEYGAPSRLLKNGYLTEGLRPHWHSLLFNYEPADSTLERITDLEHRVYNSPELTKLWGKGDLEYGELSLEAAGYVARYAAKKLVHGKDQDHNFHPIHKTSSRYALGRSWIEKNYLHTFENGFVVLPNGQPSKIPRYYVDWAKKHHPSLWEYYVTQIQPKIIAGAIQKEINELDLYIANRNESPHALKRSTVKLRILEKKFKTLQERLKL